MNYRIVGADGKVYGPVPLQQVREWVREGRAESRTPVFVDGASNWVTLSALPEVADLFTSPAALPMAPVAAPVKTKNGFATAAMVCALASWLCCCCAGLPFNLLGLILGIVAFVQCSAKPEAQEGRTLAIVAIILSVVSLIFYFGLGLIDLANGTTSINFKTGSF